MSNYPSPCVNCPKNDHCTSYRHCQPWLTRYFYKQKQINAYAKKHLPDYEERMKKGIHYED